MSLPIRRETLNKSLTKDLRMSFSLNYIQIKKTCQFTIQHGLITTKIRTLFLFLISITPRLPQNPLKIYIHGFCFSFGKTKDVVSAVH